MPVFSHIEFDLKCKKCGGSVLQDNLIGFQWGYCHQQLVSHKYKLGDHIRWRENKAGEIASWTYFKNGGGNIGDPKYENLLIKECEFYIKACLSCGFQFDCIGIEIKQHKLKSIEVYKIFPGNSEILEIKNGQYIEHPEFDDHPMEISEESGKVKAI